VDETLRSNFRQLYARFVCLVRMVPADLTVDLTASAENPRERLSLHPAVARARTYRRISGLVAEICDHREAVHLETRDSQARCTRDTRIVLFSIFNSFVLEVNTILRAFQIGFSIFVICKTPLSR
jgi:hypothetical protein